jgi:hypothetical protein
MGRDEGPPAGSANQISARLIRAEMVLAWTLAMSRVAMRTAVLGTVYLLVVGVAMVLLSVFATFSRGHWQAAASGAAALLVQVAMILPVSAAVVLFAAGRAIERMGLVTSVVRTIEPSSVPGEVIDHAAFRQSVLAAFEAVRPGSDADCGGRIRLTRWMSRFLLDRVRRRIMAHIDTVQRHGSRSIEGWLALTFGTAVDGVITRDLRTAAWRIITAVGVVSIAAMAAIVWAGRYLP